MRLFILLICVSFLVTAKAQVFPKGHYLETSLHIGKPFKHRSYISVDFSQPSFGLEINYEVKTFGKKHWHQRCGFPRWGVALSYQHPGNNKQMGSGIALQPNVTIDFFRKNKFRIFGRMGVGLGVITKPYHPVNNALNNVIGSYINNNTAFRVGAAWRFHKHFELRPSAAFTHYSNAASQLPNLGINIPSFQLGLCYMPNPVEEEDYIRTELPNREKRIQFSGLVSLGFRELSTNSGPKYGVLQIQADAGLFITRSNRLKAGIEYDYLGSIYAFMRNNGGFEGKDLKWQASRITLYIGDEIMIGRFSILIQAGVYVTQNAYQPWIMSFRLSGRYYFLDPYLSRTAPFMTITMKAHKIVAEYFSIGFGVSL